jgi:hypothetical protein
VCLSNTTPVCHCEVHIIHDHLLYLVCPGLLVAVGEISFLMLLRLTRSTQSSLLVYLFICICGVKSTLIQLIKQKSYSHNRKENNRRFPPEIITLVFISWPPHSLIQLCYQTVSISHPIPLSAANHFSYLKLSVCNPYHQWFLECMLTV